MNFLQTVQRLRRKCRVTGAGPTTVIGVQVEENARLIDWVNEAWVDIQTIRPDWLWMRTSCSFQTQLNKATYSLSDIGISSTFGNWKRDTFRNYVTSVGLNSEIITDFKPYDEWRNEYQIGAIRNSPSRPNCITIAPDLSIGLGPVPIAGYTVTGDYFKVPSEMVADADIPGLPAQFHMLIVYRAMMYYGVSESAPEIFDSGEKDFNAMLNRMSLNQIEEITLGGAL